MIEDISGKRARSWLLKELVATGARAYLDDSSLSMSSGE